MNQKMRKAGLVLISSMGMLMFVATAQVAASDIHFQLHADTTINNDSTSASHQKRYLSIGSSYGNNSSFLGRFQSARLPYIGADVTLMNRKGLWVSVMAYDIYGSRSSLDELDLMAGWNFDLSDKWDVSLFYGRYFFNEETEVLKSFVANSASASIGFDWSILYSKLSSAYIFGDDSRDLFLILDHSRYFEFPNVLGKKGYLSLDPQISLIAGTQTFYEQYVVEVEIPGGKNKGKSKGKGKDKDKGKNNNPANGPGNGTVTDTYIEENEKTSFQLMSYELSLPVMYTRGNWSIETSGRYSIPVNALGGYLTQPQFFFTSSLYYTLSSKK